MAAIVSIVLILIKKKNVNEYIAFGPFIVLSSIFIMFIPIENVLISIISLGK